MRSFINEGYVEEIVLKKNEKEEINKVDYGYGMKLIGEGDEIMI